MNSAVIVGLLFVFFVADATPLYPCKDNPGSAKVVDLKVNGKSVDKYPIQLHHGQNESLEIDFIPNKASTTATSKCYGIVSGVKVPFPVDPKACKSMKPGCPLKEGVQETFQTKIFVKKIYPEVKLIIQWEEVDENNAEILCLEIPAEILG